MNTQAKGIVGALAAIAIVLAVSLGVVLAMGDDDGMMSSRGHMDNNDNYVGMMWAMGAMDSDAMLGYMRDALGEDAYQQMVDHMAAHRTGGPMSSDVQIDRMMHTMMDGMLQHMPSDFDHIMPPGSGTHHETPAAVGTPAN